MSWFGQVLHVLRKDLRILRWGALIYVLAAALTITSALLSWQRWAPLLWVIVMCMLGALLVGQAVHNDSPTRVDSFWATRPLSASAVFGAKVLIALLVLLVPAIGEWLYLRSHDISAAFATNLAARPVAAYMVLIALALMVAVLTRSAKAFAVTFGALVLVGSVALELLPLWFGSDIGRVSAPLLFGIVIAGIGLLGWHQYRTREPRRGYAFAALLVLLMMLIPVQSAARDRAPETAVALPARLDTIPLRVDSAAVVPSGPNRMLTVKVLIGDSTLTKLYSVYIRDVTIATPARPQAAQLRFHGTWLSEDLGRSDGNVPLNADDAEMRLMYDVTDEQVALLAQPDARVVVHAHVVEREMRAQLDIPAVAGRRVSNSGHRLRIVSLGREREPVVHVRHSVLPIAPKTVTGASTLRRAGRVAERQVEGRYELVHPERKESIVLGASYDRNTETAAVLPASHAHATYITLEQRDADANRFRPINPGDAWMAGARLRYVVPVAANAYTVSAAGSVSRIAEARR